MIVYITGAEAPHERKRPALLTDMKALLAIAEKKGCAIPAFNVYNQETALGVDGPEIIDLGQEAFIAPGFQIITGQGAGEEQPGLAVFIFFQFGQERAARVSAVMEVAGQDPPSFVVLAPELQIRAANIDPEIKHGASPM